MKKTLAWLLALALPVAALALGISCRVHVTTVRPFELMNYARMMEEFPSERTVQPISSAKEAKAAAEAIWLETYGDAIQDEKPYWVYRDEDAGAWFVTGSVPYGHFGGAACILLKDNGQVLAVWHER